MVLFNNGYQIFVTSFMLHPLQHELLKTIDDLFDSKVKIHQTLTETFHHTPKFIKAWQEGRVKYFFTYDDHRWAEKSVKENIAVISHICEGNGKSWHGMYQIPEMIRLRYDLYTSPFNPSIEQFQSLMDQSFEAGLPMAWRKFYLNEKKKYLLIAKAEIIDVEKDVLDFDAILPFFLIPVIGYSIAGFSLLCEIFYHDFVSQISLIYLIKKIRVFLRKFRIRKNQKFVKKLEVKTNLGSKV
jgi:hypothetical protein